MKQSLLIVLAVLLALGVLLIVGCGSNITKISKILEQPDNYMGKTVEIAGTITKAYGVDLVISQAGAYQVDDGTGKIWVTTSNGEPSEGAKVWVKGNVARGVKILGQSFGAVIHESERKTK
jgi:hypothetical protein